MSDSWWTFWWVLWRRCLCEPTEQMKGFSRTGCVASVFKHLGKSRVCVAFRCSEMTRCLEVCVLGWCWDDAACSVIHGVGIITLFVFGRCLITYDIRYDFLSFIFALIYILLIFLNLLSNFLFLSFSLSCILFLFFSHTLMCVCVYKWEHGV